MQTVAPTLVDQVMDAYVGWREACLRVDDAYACWTGARRGNAGPAFSGYRAALDREERAAKRYAARVRHVEMELSADAMRRFEAA